MRIASLSLVALMFASSLSTGCSGQRGADAAPPQSQHEQVRRIDAPVDTVVLDGAFDAHIVPGKTSRLALVGNPRVLNNVKTTVRKGVLTISMRSKAALRSNVQLRLETPSVSRVECSGASRLHVDDVAAQRFALDLSGASRAWLTGQVDDLEIEVAGSARVDSTELRAQRVDVDLSGAGRIDVHAVATLDAEISGTGRVGYIGHPDVQRSVSGIGRIGPI
ncbi:MAG: DUF2807 domain-containing protein [Deltaproteobacteria bacterium]|nr:DUF2807 domain-containing protein [Deltaproteobacteria bacterium]